MGRGMRLILLECNEQSSKFPLRGLKKLSTSNLLPFKCPSQLLIVNASITCP
jgi:hypothetical protein